jgi:ferric iron reductase protein FhuF
MHTPAPRPMIPILGPLFAGEWAVYGEALTCPPHPEPVAGGRRCRLTDLLTHPTLLCEVLQSHAQHLGVEGGDLRATASAWSLDYLWMLLPATVGAACLLRHGLPVDPACLGLEIGPHGAPVRLNLAHQGGGLEAPLGEDAALPHLEDLVLRHLQPVFEALHRQSRLPQKILWANARRVLTGIFDAIGATACEEMPRIAALRGHLLNRPHGRDSATSPLCVASARHRNEGASGAGEPSLYAQCCLRHLLPGQTHCGPCPLSPTLGLQRGQKDVGAVSPP